MKNENEGTEFPRNDFSLNQFSRTEILLGKDAMKKLAASRVAVFGIGGVGGFAVEALIRSGVGALDLIDSDRISLTNLNRQIAATQKTIGLYKVDVAKNRCMEINPDAEIRTYRIFFSDETKNQLDFEKFDYIIDAIDTVSAKIVLVQEAKKYGKKIISSMGAGNKLDATKFAVADISKTSVCPLARVMRHELKKRGISSLKVVFSTEKPVRPDYSGCAETKGSCGRPAPGSTSFVPSAAGLILAGEVIRELSAE
jgi:tRNA A37 threonylcarbamoyladenosine dehydratase